MNRSLTIVFFLGALLTLGAYQSAYANDLVAAGEKSYAQADYKSALDSFRLETLKSPKNASAHYLLANTYEKLGCKSDAIHEYQVASRLDRVGQAGAYSRFALSIIQIISESNNKNIGSQSSSLTQGSDGSKNNDLPNSDNTAPDYFDEYKERLEQEHDAIVEQIRAQAAEQNRRIEQDNQSEFRITRSGSIAHYNADYYNSQKKEVNAVAARRVEEADNAYREKQAALDSAAINFGKSNLTPIKEQAVNH